MWALGQPVPSRDCSLQAWVEASSWQGTFPEAGWVRWVGQGWWCLEKEASNPTHSSHPCPIERQDQGTALEREQLCYASRRAQLTRRLRQDPAGESCAGLGVGLTLGGRSKNHPSGLCLLAKKPGKGLSCASVEVPFNKWQPGSSLIHSSTIRLQTNAVGLLKPCQSQ